MELITINAFYIVLTVVFMLTITLSKKEVTSSFLEVEINQPGEVYSFLI